MLKTIAFATNQACSDRLIHAAALVAEETNTELVIVNILDSEYEIDPVVVDEHFAQSKKYKATMRLIFSDDKLNSMLDIISPYESHYIITGMPSSHSSVLYNIWNKFGDKIFYSVDCDGELVEVASRSMQSVPAF